MFGCLFDEFFYTNLPIAMRSEYILSEYFPFGKMLKF